jgi:phosphoribosyl-ATP pyrophosphohydrolase
VSWLEDAMAIQLRVQRVTVAAVETWGPPSQWGMVVEECAELIASLNQWQRERVTAEVVAHEVADVVIMMSQARFMLAQHGVDVDRVVAEKLARLEAKIEREREADHADQP